MGVANPDKIIEGVINNEEPRIACCCVLHSEEINKPTPTIQLTNRNILKYSSARDPVKGMLKIKIAAKIMNEPSSMLMKMDGRSLPIKISTVDTGETSS